MTDTDKNTAKSQAKASDNDIAALSFEQAINALEKVVQSLENGDLPLDEAIDLYEYGVKLKTHSEKKLHDAKMRVEKITLKGDGSIKGVESFDDN